MISSLLFRAEQSNERRVFWIVGDNTDLFPLELDASKKNLSTIQSVVFKARNVAYFFLFL